MGTSSTSPPGQRWGCRDATGALHPALLGGRAGQAVLGAGHAEGLQGMGVPGAVPPQKPRQGLARSFTPSCPDLAAKGSAASQAPVAPGEMPPPDWAAQGRGAGLCRSSGSATQVTVCPHTGELSSSSCLAAAFTSSPTVAQLCLCGGFPQPPPQTYPSPSIYHICRFLCLKTITKPLPRGARSCAAAIEGR